MKVLVTGTSRGLGAATAVHLAELGHDVVGCARGPAETAGFRHIAGIDFRDPDSLAPLTAEFATCDGLVNNVGVALDGLLATQSERAIAEVIEVNLTMALIVTRRYVRERLRVRRPGIIVNVASIVSIRGYAGLAAYSASKAGLDGMSRSLARELGPKGFRVNSVLPGFMDTTMTAGLDAGQRRLIVRRTPLGRLATVADVVPVIAFLLSDHAGFITGQSLIVDGGITV